MCQPYILILGVIEMGKKKKVKKVEYGHAELYCKHCKYTFEMPWEIIWDIQECTHGYVGYHLDDTYISCPKCGEICDNDQLEEIPKENRISQIPSDDLPF